MYMALCPSSAPPITITLLFEPSATSHGLWMRRRGITSSPTSHLGSISARHKWARREKEGIWEKVTGNEATWNGASGPMNGDVIARSFDWPQVEWLEHETLTSEKGIWTDLDEPRRFAMGAVAAGRKRRRTRNKYMGGVMGNETR